MHGDGGGDAACEMPEKPRSRCLLLASSISANDVESPSLLGGSSSVLLTALAFQDRFGQYFVYTKSILLGVLLVQ